MDMTDMTRAAVSRRHFLQLAGAGMLALAGTSLTGCGNSTSGEGSDKGSKLAAIKSRGHLNAGVKKDVPGYGYYDTAKGRFEGMEVDLCYQIAAAVFGVSYKEARAQELVEFTDVTPKTRGPLIDNGQLDVVAATYTITDERKKLVSFAGPYYYTQQAILVLADNDDIKSVDDLADKNVAVQSGSNGPAILEEFAPKASQQEFKTDEEARQALQQGRVDAYVIDNNMQQSALVREPGKYKIAGKPFGSKEPYGIGLPLDSDGVAFVNDFLKKIEDDGTWTELWQICIGDRTGDTNVPELPEVGA